MRLVDPIKSRSYAFRRVVGDLQKDHWRLFLLFRVDKGMCRSRNGTFNLLKDMVLFYLGKR